MPKSVTWATSKDVGWPCNGLEGQSKATKKRTRNHQHALTWGDRVKAWSGRLHTMWQQCGMVVDENSVRLLGCPQGLSEDP